MRPRSYLLTAIGATVVVGGIYLWLDVRGSDAARPSAAALAEAQARHAQAGAMRPDSDRRRPFNDDAPVAPPPATRAELPRPRVDLPGTDPAVFNTPPPIELPDRLRASGAVQPAIDPDDPELVSAMTESNKAYDRGDYEGARALAIKLLGKEPGNVRMLRVAVSSSCIMGDADLATKYWAQLPAADQAQMSIRCSRYQVSFPTAAPGPTMPTEK